MQTGRKVDKWTKTVATDPGWVVNESCVVATNHRCDSANGTQKMHNTRTNQPAHQSLLCCATFCAVPCIKKMFARANLISARQAHPRLIHLHLTSERQRTFPLAVVVFVTLTKFAYYHVSTTPFNFTSHFARAV